MLPRSHGTCSVTGRHLFTLELESPEELPEAIALASSRFVGLVAWDAQEATTEEISRLARKLLDSGAAYLCAWGSDCARVHDIIDEEELGPDPSSSDDRVVMTTWHEGEPLSDAVEFALFATTPHQSYAAGCDSTLAVVVGSPAWAAEVRASFTEAARQ